LLKFHLRLGKEFLSCRSLDSSQIFKGSFLVDGICVKRISEKSRVVGGPEG